MGPISGVGRCVTRKQDPETRGEGQMEISGVISVSPLSVTTRIAISSMASAVLTTASAILYRSLPRTHYLVCLGGSADGGVSVLVIRPHQRTN